MAPIKRKSEPTNESFARTKKAGGNDDRPMKRPRQDDAPSSQTEKRNGNGKEGASNPIHVPKVSKIKEEETAFPRGGASVLTPLEHKQIHADATRDVLFEQQTAPGPKSDGAAEESTAPAAKKRKPKSKGKKNEPAEEEDDHVRIEGLSYKRLHLGSLVLGQVSQINAHDIALALPNNLTGYVPITSISDKLTERVERMVAEDSQSDDDNSDTEDDIDLNAMFSIGQYLRAFVVSTSDNNPNKPAEGGKRRIELSLNPQQSNIGLTTRELVPNSMIMASVVSVEDHGLIMDIGQQKAGVGGFMSSKEIGSTVNMAEIREGAVFLCMITGSSSSGKIVKLSADAQRIANTKKLNYVAEAPSVDAFLPGTAIELLVTDVSTRGVAGKIMGMLDATADLIHSGLGNVGKSLDKKYKIGSKVKGRIVCTFPNIEPKKIGISLLDHVMSLSVPTVLESGQKRDPLEILPPSRIVEAITVKRVQSGIGLFVDVGVKGVPGFVHISRVTDGKIDTLSELTGPYKVDSVHRGRIVGYNALDGVFLVSLEQRILEQPFLRIEDLDVGQVVKGKIEKLLINADGVGGLFVNLADGITGLVPAMHMADVTLLHPEKRFKEGMKVTARVLSTDTSKRQIRLTLKKTLVNSEAAIFKSYANIELGMQSPGTIVSILPDGAVVQFYGAVRGFLPIAEMSESFIHDPSQHFRIGQVVNVRVLKIDPATAKLAVSCRDPSISESSQEKKPRNEKAVSATKKPAQSTLTLEDLSKNMILSGRVTKVNERQIMVQLSETLFGPVHLTDLSDDFSEANPTIYSKNDVVKVCVTDIDVPNKRIRLSTRPSRVLNSSLAVKDPEISSISQLKVNEIVRGFVKNVADNGVFINLGGDVTAYVRVSDLSDAYIKDWKSTFQIDQLVKGRIIVLDQSLNHVQLSLKASVVDDNYVAPATFNDMKVGQIVTGKIRKVEDFGAFIVVDNSMNVSGLCHRSEMAEDRVNDVRKLYSEGDEVKAKISKIDSEKKRISFSLKASHFEGSPESDEEMDSDSEDGMNGVRLDGSESSEDEDAQADDDEDEEESQPSNDEQDVEMEDAPEESSKAPLQAGGFDWTASVLDDAGRQNGSDTEEDGAEDDSKKKKSRKPTIKVDRTGELDANGPQSTSDFERLLLGQPDSSQLWIAYMAFQMNLSELGKAREIAERALRTINIREETEKLNVWIALLNLENVYGSDEATEEVFKRACQYNDALEVHERLASIYIQSGKHSKADELFQVLVKKFSQSPNTWCNYAHFLQNTLSAPDRARQLLPRALQSLPPHTHLSTTVKFAALEFRSAHGSPERGRTMFEGVLSTYPKRLDLWNQLLDLEMQQGDHGIIRNLFERVIKTKGLKPRGVKAWFKRWSDWEGKHGDSKSQEKVTAKAKEWVHSAAEKKT